MFELPFIKINTKYVQRITNPKKKTVFFSGIRIINPL